MNSDLAPRRAMLSLCVLGRWFRQGLCFALLSAFAAVGCARVPPQEQTSLKPGSFSDLRQQVPAQGALSTFRLRGPFQVTQRRDLDVRLPGNRRVPSDLFVPTHTDRAPLVILMHGYESSKEAHEFQAMHLASWGLFAMTVQLGKRGPWNTHADTLRRLVMQLRARPDVLDKRIDPSRIVLAGHSFGAASVVMALGSGTPAAAAILLDPAAVGRDIASSLLKVDKPVLILGADDTSVRTRNRDFFYRYIRRDVAELSIRDATHDDAQFPSEYAVQNGNDPYTTEDLQVTFTAALTAAAFSLTVGPSFEYAWSSYAPAFSDGMFFGPKKK